MARYLQRHRIPMLAGVILIAAATGAAANDFPNNTIRIISMHPAGSVTDVLARPLAQRLTASLKVPVIVENRPGANGIIATGYVAKTPADGYTLLITSGSHIANAHIGKPLPYDPIADFAPIIQLSNSYGLALITNLPANNVQELIQLAKKKELTYAINGVGNVTHIAGLLFERMAGVKMVPVPYNTPALASDVMSGTVDIAFFSVAGSAPLAQDRRVKALAVTGPRRSPALPNSPTLRRARLQGFRRDRLFRGAGSGRNAERPRRDALPGVAQGPRSAGAEECHRARRPIRGRRRPGRFPGVPEEG